MELEGVQCCLPISLLFHKPDSQVIVCACLQRRYVKEKSQMKGTIMQRIKAQNVNLMYLGVDMTGQEGGTKHEVSNIID